MNCFFVLQKRLSQKVRTSCVHLFVRCARHWVNDVNGCLASDVKCVSSHSLCKQSYPYFHSVWLIKRNGPRNVPNTDAKPFGRDVLPVALIHDVVNCCLLGSVARRGTEESVFRNKTRKHTSKWRTTRTSSVYFPMIPIPYRFVPEVVGLHVPSCPSLNFISPTEAWDPAWFWPDYCMHSKVTQWGIFLGKTPNTKERSNHYM